MRRAKFIRLSIVPLDGSNLFGSLDCAPDTAKGIAYALLLASSADIGSDPLKFTVNEK